MSFVTYHHGNDSVAPAYLAVPRGEGRWPAVVVVQDVLGMTADLRRTADRLAENGYIALAPALYAGGLKIRCLIATLRAASAGIGTGYAPLVAARDFLQADERCTGKIGLLGFCMGGQLALQLSVGGLFDACAANYGVLPKDLHALRDACPVVASYGAKDLIARRGSAARLDAALAKGDVPRDIREYPDVGHGFINDWRFPGPVRFIERAVGASYSAAEAEDAWRRMLEFFNCYLPLDGPLAPGPAADAAGKTATPPDPVGLV
ncbi:dienelactone hydrolase family protein [Mycolicibacterium aubagnense]|nr:dienelactone hydrolase family protein [Mycolicibacterium aubagnense]TLH48585.1 carboxymethylenebutenolidase [Mycolicibacterium aubagnense]